MVQNGPRFRPFGNGAVEDSEKCRTRDDLLMEQRAPDGSREVPAPVRIGWVMDAETLAVLRYALAEPKQGRVKSSASMKRIFGNPVLAVLTALRID